MGIDGSDSLVGTRFQQLGRNDLLDSENDAILGADADGRASILDSLHCVLDLEVAAVGGEDGVEQVIARSYGRLEAQARPG